MLLKRTKMQAISGTMRLLSIADTRSNAGACLENGAGATRVAGCAKTMITISATVLATTSFRIRGTYL